MNTESAFPCRSNVDGNALATTEHDAKTGMPFTVLYQPGQDLRDYFAGQALAGLCALEAYWGGSTIIAGSAYDIAEAMLAERKKRQ